MRNLHDLHDFRTGQMVTIKEATYTTKHFGINDKMRNIIGTSQKITGAHSSDTGIGIDGYTWHYKDLRACEQIKNPKPYKKKTEIFDVTLLEV
jgi:hypothetical protein